MPVVDEYIQRHSIKVPLVKYVRDHGYFFLREETPDNKTKWQITYIHYLDDSSHPGTYRVLHHTVGHDRSFREHLNYRNAPSYRSDDYEQYIYDWSSEVRSKIYKQNFNPVVLGKKHVQLTAWEMLIYSNDSYVTQELKAYGDLLYSTLDLSCSLDIRYNNFALLTKLLSEKKDEVVRQWLKDINFYLNNYCVWLAELIHNG